MRRTLKSFILVNDGSGDPVINPSQSTHYTKEDTLEVYAPGVKRKDVGWHRDCVLPCVLTYDDGKPAPRKRKGKR